MGTKVYFFKDKQYARYDRVDDRVDEGYPLPIAGNWSGMSEVGFADAFDAAVNWGNGKLFFFRGDRYLRYDVAADKIDDGYPQSISANWPGLAAAGFAQNIDGALPWGNGKVFFFCGERYLRYDGALDRTDDGYPLPIADNWPGLREAGFSGGVSGSIDLFTDKTELWVPTATVIKSPVNGPKFLPLPWRGVLHTTEGVTVEDAVSSFRSTNFWPHFTIDPKSLRVVQHLPLNIGARSLSDHATAENAAHCIQIEIVGKAAETPNWAPEQFAFVRDVVRQIEDLVPIPHASGRRFLDASAVNATPGNRMSVDEWKTFSGWCGHQHVPGETHWD